MALRFGLPKPHPGELNVGVQRQYAPVGLGRLGPLLRCRVPFGLPPKLGDCHQFRLIGDLLQTAFGGGVAGVDLEGLLEGPFRLFELALLQGLEAGGEPFAEGLFGAAPTGGGDRFAQAGGVGIQGANGLVGA